jgi:hypothetical protein
MAASGAQRRDFGTRIVSGGALLGAVVSIFNYFYTDSGISDTPGALLVVITSVLVFTLGLLVGALRTGSLRRVASTACLLLILGTGFAGYLLESPTLLAAMVV